MRHLAFSLPLLALLATCGPLTLYHKPGVSVARLQQDELTCETRALRDAPVANELRQDPPIFVPPRRVCGRHGHCRTHGGYWRPGNIYTVDVNAGLRRRIEAQCMASKGYRPAQIPLCPPGTKVSGPTNVLPPLTERSCAVRLETGGFAIVEGAPAAP
ncbi:hypothetical protein E4Z66_03990 [Aliishimia ponticola]|uniref:Uncharacterized protein n=2 Tax=Aliishimia ponticola TaxID=2499833 RepID=A0A4S4NHM8_9RHOB|nr:hypothetical protein E4Z66_03990 [Aliishimia ponticola]